VYRQSDLIVPGAAKPGKIHFPSDSALAHSARPIRATTAAATPPPPSSEQENADE
jgi:hypothetical protein